MSEERLFDYDVSLTRLDDNDGYLDDFESGHAVQIIDADTSGHAFTLNEASLERLLMKDDIREKNVVVISVAGAFRKGKSFLLDFFLRYLDSRYKRKDITNWIGPDDLPLDGFCWKGGSERVTAGILMWSEIFVTKVPTGHEVAIILLDTQGAFDTNSTVCDCATIFAISTMVSSVQVYNISQNIQEDDLQHLQLFAEYGRLALADCGRVPFQKLLFLVRDWCFPYEANYGKEGGQQLLEKRLQISSNQHTELQFLRKHIKSCFTDISCFLMPHPGLMVATNPHFDGKIRDIEPEFINSIECLAPLLLAPENLTIKKISGQIVKAKELFLYFKTYIKVFSGSDLPQPKSMLVATAEANNLAALATAKENYVVAMENYCGGRTPFMRQALLQDEHSKQKTIALEYFSKKRKMGGNELSEKYKEQLSSDLEQMFIHYTSHNESKNIFKSAKTPAVFMTLAILCYLFSNILSFLTLTTVAGIFNLFTTLSVLTLATWTYTRYSGDHVEICNLIDLAGERLWENFLRPTFLSLTEKNLEENITIATLKLDNLNNRIEETVVNK